MPEVMESVGGVSQNFGRRNIVEKTVPELTIIAKMADTYTTSLENVSILAQTFRLTSIFFSLNRSPSFFSHDI